MDDNNLQPFREVIYGCRNTTTTRATAPSVSESAHHRVHEIASVAIALVNRLRRSDSNVKY